MKIHNTSFEKTLKLLMLSKQQVNGHDNSRTELDRDFGFFAIDWYQKMLARDCFWYMCVKGKVVKTGKTFCMRNENSPCKNVYFSC